MRARAFTLLEIMVVVAITGVLATIAVGTIRKTAEQVALEQALTSAETSINNARDVARSELRCVTVAKAPSALPAPAIVATVHPCGQVTPYATDYANGVPRGAERELFRLQLDPAAFINFEVVEQLCVPPAECPAVPCHGFGDLFEFRTDGSTDASYLLNFTKIDGSLIVWDIHAATGTVRPRAGAATIGAGAEE